MKLVVRKAAAADFDAAIARIAKDSPRAAETLRNRIGERINRLIIPGFSHIGRPGQVSGTRELVVQPYIIVYEIDIRENQINFRDLARGTGPSAIRPTTLSAAAYILNASKRAGNGLDSRSVSDQRPS